MNLYYKHLNKTLTINKTAASHDSQANNRSSCSGVLKNFRNFTGKHPCWSLFLIKLQVLRPATLLKSNFDTGVSFYFPIHVKCRIFFLPGHALKIFKNSTWDVSYQRISECLQLGCNGMGCRNVLRNAKFFDHQRVL